MNEHDNYVAMMLEQIHNQNQVMLEPMSEMKKQVTKLSHIEEKVDELSQDAKVIKAAVTDTNKDLHKLEGRVTLLEQPA